MTPQELARQIARETEIEGLNEEALAEILLDFAVRLEALEFVAREM